ncbi:MAG TPA: GNAT family N-acetyltransferase [Gaiellales bacterium]|jgi:acetyl coenzyme A synthetase (ADP forming)-like protein
MSSPPDSPTSSHVRDVILRHGRTLRLRPPTPADADAVLAFFAGLDDESRYLRFHGTRRIGPDILDGLLEPDWATRGALIGVLRGEDGEEAVVAVASYARLRDPRMAEAAFAVATEMQGLGVGTRLVEQLAAAAARAGVETLVADVMADNDAMLQVFADTGYDVERTFEGGEIQVLLQIAASDRFLEAVDRRDHSAIDQSLGSFFRPETVAVIGASARPGAIGGAVFRNIIEGGFTGRAFPINRSGEPVAGVPAVHAIEEVPEKVDLVVVCVPAAAVHAAVASALTAGVRAICVITAGFAETGPEGARAERELLTLVRSYGARMIGPNCLGLASSDVHMNATFSQAGFAPGRVAVSSQSGAVGLAVLEGLERRGLGVSSFVSVGNKADVSSNDLLEHWEDDESTGTIALYLESFGNPRRFGRIARRVSRTKPIVALKGGSTAIGSRAAQSHTAALAGSDAAVEALFRQSGVLRAATLEELLDLTDVLASQPLPHGRRTAILTNAGGLGILCGDACSNAGLELSELAQHTREHISQLVPGEATVLNPVDIIGSATPEMFGAVTPFVLGDQDVDALIVLVTATAVADPDDVIAAIAAAAKATDAEKPVLIVVTGGASTRIGAGLPCFAYPETAARVLGRVAERAEWLRQPIGRVRDAEVDRAAGEEIVAATLAAGGEGWLDPDAVERLLGAYGIPTAAQRLVQTGSQALAAAETLGFPVVVKAGAAGVHKTEKGGVVLDVRTPAELAAATTTVGFPAVIQPMVRGGVEVMAGAMQDPVFGPVVAFGMGGTMAELLGEIRFAPAPLTDVDADQLVAAGKAGALLGGMRGAAPADSRALADLVRRLAQLAADFHQIVELDLNPVMARPNGCLAVDARIRVEDSAALTALKTW